MDEVSIGCEAECAAGRKLGASQPWVVVAVEREGQRLGGVRLGLVADDSAASLKPLVQAAVQPRTTARTGGWPSYGRLG